MRLLTTEQVSNGHPDIVTELIADAILDELIKQTDDLRTGIEVLGSGKTFIIAGEINIYGADIDLDKVIKDAIQNVYQYLELEDDLNHLEIINRINVQSSDIAALVDREDGQIGGSDQGMMLSYAYNDPTTNYLPEAHWLCNEILAQRDELWKDKTTWLGQHLKADAKTQITWNPEDGKIHTVVLSTQTTDGADLPTLRQELITQVLKPVLGHRWHDDIELFINEKPFEIGGIVGDAGLNGRKLAARTAMGSIGGSLKIEGFNEDDKVFDLPLIAMQGGASSGKYVKVDRDGHFLTRYLAKNIVASTGIESAFVQIAYVIGHPQPLSLYVEGRGLTNKQNKDLAKQIYEKVDMSPKGIIERFNLRQPMYYNVTKTGQFSDSNFPWEQLDLGFTLLED